MRPLTLVCIVASFAGCELAVSLDHLQGGCPPKPGPTTVRVSAGSHAYCIDGTEVTNAHYAAFLAAHYSLAGSGAPGGCDQIADFTPVQDWPAMPGHDAFPVHEVTWCDAYAYCRWAGKRLCGQIGGGPLAQQYEVDATQSQWFAACSGGGKHMYPYGDTYDPNACGGKDAMSMLGIVGTHPSCVGGFSGLFDMSGSVWEWTDTCASDMADEFCHVRGGAYDSTQMELACSGPSRNWKRNSGANNIGLRCCFDL